MIQKRPLCLVWILLMIVIWLMRAFGAPVSGVLKPDRLAPAVPEDGMIRRVQGTVRSRKETNASFQYILKDVLVTELSDTSDPSGTTHTEAQPAESDKSRIQIRDSRPIHFQNLLLSAPKDQYCAVGSVIRGLGEVKQFEPAGNPGQFDARSYYACYGIY